uniref:MBL fold metallo-hydrolase n=1 Tax=Altererythrobacter segetis TaxID=1104773 RepID=UPI00140C535A|nr:MBL fold metallo-hydrolase [Altererythrobacter segetis]
MKTKVVLAILAAGSLAAMASAQQAPQGAPGAAPGRPAGPPRGGGLPPPEPIEHVKDNVYKIFGGGGNTLVVVQKDGVVLVDTKMPGNGPYIDEQVKKVTDKPIKLIINTHSHPDHVGSNDYFREHYPNARIIMNEGAKEELSGGPRPSPALLPTETYKDRMTIGSGADRIELYHFGRGHTNGDTFVLFPAARLLCMGDVMAWNMAPFLPAGGAEAIAEETGALVKAMKGKVDLVEEGHGHINNWAGLVRLAKFDRALVDAAKVHYDRMDPPGMAVADLQKNADFAPLLDTHIKKGLEYGNTPRARANMNVNIAYLEFAGEPVGFGVANGQPLPATDKHKGSDPKDTAPPTPEMLATAVAK